MLCAFKDYNFPYQQNFIWAKVERLEAETDSYKVQLDELYYLTD